MVVSLVAYGTADSHEARIVFTVQPKGDKEMTVDVLTPITKSETFSQQQTTVNAVPQMH